MTRRLAKPAVFLLFLFLVSGCGQVKKWYYCGYGHQTAQNREYESAIDLLDDCLELKSLMPEQRAYYLQTRAWAYFSLDDFRSAVRDQERSFELVPPSTQRHFINYGAYLRMAGRPGQSLEALRKAEEMDRRTGMTSMMTQYNLGWTLYDLGRYEEAISEFSRGIPEQPDYPFVYFRRGLAYDKIGRVEEAESDFSEFVAFFEIEDLEFNPRFAAELAEASRKYSELRLLLKEAN